MQTTQELAWLRFNRRVLDETTRPDFPVLERLRFLGIWSSKRTQPGPTPGEPGSSTRGSVAHSSEDALQSSGDA